MTSGRYDLTDVKDCIRLVRSARPSRMLQERMFDAIERTPGAPTREQILEAMKEDTDEKAKHRNAE